MRIEKSLIGVNGKQPQVIVNELNGGHFLMVRFFELYWAMAETARNPQAEVRMNLFIGEGLIVN